MYRDLPAQCPNCNTRLSEGEHFSQRCDRCQGVLLPIESFESLLQQSRPQTPLPELMEFQDESATQRCPICNAMMQRVWLDFLSFERCHGLWFDKGKLELALGPPVSAKEVEALSPKSLQRRAEFAAQNRPRWRK